ncbi:MAG: Dyp-type peroxidase [Candidatus Nanopelagicales bacterium]|nr:Dyp-type peroxidase [Candidatus Nanopelagicales bacterium]
MTHTSQAPTSGSPRVSRRGLLAVGGAGILGAAGGFIVGRESAPMTSDQPATAATAAAPQTYDFHGAHQAGISTPAQQHAAYLGINLQERSTNALAAVLRLVSDDAARMMAGKPALADPSGMLAATASGLTITVGLGHRAFELPGMQASRPEAFAALPAFATDAFEPGWGDTDLLVHIGSQDPLVLSHAIRVITVDLSTLARIAWIQQGFRALPDPSGATGRNLMGQVDGTVNPVPGTAEFDETVWMQHPSPAINGGTVLILRRIRMLLDTWDVLDTGAKELVIGRDLSTGAPLGGTSERDPMPLAATNDLGLPVIPTDAHARLAHASTPRTRILRRPYSYDHGMHAGTNDVGLLFVAYTQDPRDSFIPMQRRLAESDALNRWVSTIGSASYFVPPGVREGGFIGEGLLA